MTALSRSSLELGLRPGNDEPALGDHFLSVNSAVGIRGVFGGRLTHFQNLEKGHSLFGFVVSSVIPATAKPFWAGRPRMASRRQPFGSSHERFPWQPCQRSCLARLTILLQTACDSQPQAAPPGQRRQSEPLPLCARSDNIWRLSSKLRLARHAGRRACLNRKELP